jgi:hypothetical protein
MTIKCSPLAHVTLHQDFEIDRRGQLIAEAGTATDRLELTLVEDVLLVRVGEHGTDRYKVVGNTKSFLSAVFVGSMIPNVNSIVVDKEKGYVVWSLNEPADLGIDAPYSESIYFTCQ